MKRKEKNRQQTKNMNCYKTQKMEIYAKYIEWEKN